MLSSHRSRRLVRSFVSLASCAASVPALAAKYDCTAFHMGSDLPEQLGTMKIDSIVKEHQSVALNAENDFVTCTGSGTASGSRPLVACVFSPAAAEAQIRFVPGKDAGQLLALGSLRSHFSGRVTATPVAAVSDDASSLLLMLPADGEKALYGVVCKSAGAGGSSQGIP